MASYSIVDENGQLDASYLERELRSALEFDVHHKQTDSMKKRACKVARDYDEFKNMVAAAHLKTLTKSEVESLSHVKKGWKKEEASELTKEKRLATTAQILEKERKENEIKASTKSTIEVPGAYNKGKSKPKTASAVERDLRRISDVAEKFEYLKWLGIKKGKIILGSSDTDFIEELLRVLVSNMPSMTDNTEEEQLACTSSSGSCKSFNIRLYKWLNMLSSLQKFDLMLQFSSAATSVSRPAVISTVAFLKVLLDAPIDGLDTMDAPETEGEGVKMEREGEAGEDGDEGPSKDKEARKGVTKDQLRCLMDKYSVYLK